MKKLLIICALLSSYSLYAEHRGTADKVEGTFPELKKSSADNMAYSMGLTAGVNSPESTNDDTGVAGAIVGFQPIVPLGLGLEVNTSRFNNGDDQNYKSIATLARATYNFGGDIPVIRHSFLGAAGGPLFLSNSNTDQVEWGIAPLAGFDIPLAERKRDVISLGLDAKYLITTDTPDAVVAQGAVKYWF